MLGRVSVCYLHLPPIIFGEVSELRKTPLLFFLVRTFQNHYHAHAQQLGLPYIEWTKLGAKQTILITLVRAVEMLVLFIV